MLPQGEPAIPGAECPSSSGGMGEGLDPLGDAHVCACAHLALKTGRDGPPTLPVDSAGQGWQGVGSPGLALP